MSLRNAAGLALFVMLAILPPAHAVNQSQPTGTGINSIKNWGTSVPFVDLFKSAREDTPGTVYTVINPAITPALPSGDYIVQYQGTGTLDYAGSGTVNLSQSQPGRDVISFDTSTSNAYLEITISNSDALDPIHDIHVTLPGGICAATPTTRVDDAAACLNNDYLAFESHHEAILFNPDFIAYSRQFRILRYMDFMETNASPVVQWSDRTLLDDTIWSGHSGAPVEVMVALANRSDANPWFTLPHMADDNYIQEFARYVRDHLNPNLKAYIEYTNEAWSPGNVQGRYMRDQGIAAGLDTDRNKAGGMYYSARAVEIFNIWETEFASLDRLVRVLSGQLVNPWLSGIILNHEDAYLHADKFGVNAYISGDINYFRNDATTVDDIFIEMRNPNTTKLSLPLQKEHIQTHAALVNPLGLDLVAYEGGQSLVDFTTSTDDQHPNPLFIAANRDPEMAVMYQEILDAWKTAGGTMFVHFSAPEVFNKSGSWGVKEAITQPRAEAPKFDALMSFNETTACWWTNCTGTSAATIAAVAEFTVTSDELAITVDATASADSDGAIRSYHWNFGDGTAASGETASHNYSQAGSYDVTLVVIDNENNSSSLQQQITVSVTGQNLPPVAVIAATTDNLTIELDASTSSDPDGSITDYTWDFGDGDTGVGAIATHTYASEGDYSITLTVTDNEGLTATTSTILSVSAPVQLNQSPIAAFDIVDTELSVTVDGSNSSDADGSITTYEWDFGDGTTATGESATHAYAVDGDYSISLRVTDDDGATNTSSVTITVAASTVVNATPVAAFTMTENELSIEVDASTSTDADGAIDSYSWDFGDSSSATGTIATHTFAAAGDYNVTLTVTDNLGATHSITQSVTVTTVDSSDAGDSSGGSFGLIWLFAAALIARRRLNLRQY